MLFFSLITVFNVFVKILNRKGITITIGLKRVPKWVQVSINVDLTRKCCSHFVGSKWVQSNFIRFFQFKITIEKILFSHHEKSSSKCLCWRKKSVKLNIENPIGGIKESKWKPFISKENSSAFDQLLSECLK